MKSHVERKLSCTGCVLVLLMFCTLLRVIVCWNTFYASIATVSYIDVLDVGVHLGGADIHVPFQIRLNLKSCPTQRLFNKHFSKRPLIQVMICKHYYVILNLFLNDVFFSCSLWHSIVMYSP